MSTTRKILPENLAGIKKLLEKDLKIAKKKLQDMRKKQLELESIVNTCQDGIQWCERVYEMSKPKAE